MSLTLKIALSPLLIAQAVWARQAVPRLPEAAGGRAGARGRGPALHLLIAGDSAAAGVGVADQSQALAGQLVPRLAAACQARVHWQLLARSGLTTAQTLDLLREAQPAPLADVALVVTGVNDVVDQVPSHRAVAARDAMANRLRNACGVAHVLFMPVPPIDRFPGLPQPLRWVAGQDARRHNAALRDWAATRHDVSVPDWDLDLGAGAMASDGFHPGEPVYRSCAEAVASHVARHVWPDLRPAATG
ncbi:MAG: SGNH/GDSL hydrolase family protein [Aquabacterium sp.]